MATYFGSDDIKGPFKSSYQASAGADKIIKNNPGYLHGILVGKAVSNSVIEVSDHISDGDGNVKVYLSGDDLLGYYPIEIMFEAGITADLTEQTNVLFIYK